MSIDERSYCLKRDRRILLHQTPLERTLIVIPVHRRLSRMRRKTKYHLVPGDGRLRQQSLQCPFIGSCRDGWRWRTQISIVTIFATIIGVVIRIAMSFSQESKLPEDVRPEVHCAAAPPVVSY
jgi:hypothetical protein